MIVTANAERSPATPEEIWAILRETAERQKEADRRWEEARAEDAKRRKEAETEAAKRRAEYEAEAAKRWAEYEVEAAKRRAEHEAEAAKWRAEAAKRRAEAAKRRAEYEAEAAKRKEEADERKAELDKMWQETLALWNKDDDKLKTMRDALGGLSNTFDQVVEHLVIPGIEERLGELGLRFQHISSRRRVKNESGNTEMEIDVVLENSDTIVAVETKAKPSMDDISEFGEKLARLREILLGMGDSRRILGLIAGAVFGSAQKQVAYEAGLFVVVQAGDTMKMDIPRGFKPKEW